MNKKSDYIRQKLKVLPELPGVYQFLDKAGNIIYVGKAKKLNKRVASYFIKQHDSGKTRILVSKVADIHHIVVETETDALLLENNLIKKYQPRYNVLLKDDKSYPYICIKNESFPRVFLTRNVYKDGSKYFGPYTSVRMVRVILDMFRQLYKLRTCKHNLSPENIAKNKFKVCLEYHIKNCYAPCIGLQTEDEYKQYINEISSILKGDIRKVIQNLKESMIKFSDNFEYEKAQALKQKIELLENYRSKSTVVNPSVHDVDVFSIIDDELYAYVNFMKIINGSIIQVHTVELKKKLDEDIHDLLILAIVDIRQKFNSISKEILVPFIPDTELEGVRFIVPKIGDKKKLLELSEKNVKYYLLEKNKQRANIDPEKHTKRILLRMQKDLRLPVLPRHIECFDNSNIQGTHPVAACVVFRNGKPYKKDYRHFHVKTVEGPDDFASMEEIIYRRYKRMLNENLDLPQLIIIDGGKGQLSTALKSLEKLNLRGKISIIGIAKKLEEIYFPGDSIPLYLDKNSETLKIIQQARNEAHRFGITFHRQMRSKEFLHSELEYISGIGNKTIEQLYTHFQNLEGIKNASYDDLKSLIGSAKAKLIKEYFTK
ncbi:MAG: excinuclease ABC subunit UvrC [Bacteroidales bacterium]|nr:excinuclease ABC subunit UvrC [Bacteroidales bacterium]